jgi:ABC-type transport system involved in multi-copper enzyme maturation permease subunit
MWSAFWDAFQEAGGRRVIVSLVILAIVVGLLFNRSVHFEKLNNVDVIYQGEVNQGPFAFAVPSILGQVTLFAGMIWMMLMIFAGCPQFVAMLEKGWRELTFSKATPRWQLMLARYMSLLLLFFVLILMTCLPLTLHLWWRTGILQWNIIGGILIHSFTFGSLLAIGALVSMAGEAGVALPILAPVAMFISSQPLLGRDRFLYPLISSDIGRRAVDWLYYLLPKCQELQNAAAEYVRASSLPSSWPVWTTGVFILSSLGLMLWILERKSF